MRGCFFIMRKNNLITELQNNKKVRGYKELQKSLIKNCNQINEKLQEENYRIKNSFTGFIGDVFMINLNSYKEKFCLEKNILEKLKVLP